MNIPPLISRTPPPLPDDDDDDDDDDEFGHYVIGDIIENGAADVYDDVIVEETPVWGTHCNHSDDPRSTDEGIATVGSDIQLHPDRNELQELSPTKDEHLPVNVDECVSSGISNCDIRTFEPQNDEISEAKKVTTENEERLLSNEGDHVEEEIYSVRKEKTIEIRANREVVEEDVVERNDSFFEEPDDDFAFEASDFVLNGDSPVDNKNSPVDELVSPGSTNDARLDLNDDPPAADAVESSATNESSSFPDFDNTIQVGDTELPEEDDDFDDFADFQTSTADEWKKCPSPTPVAAIEGYGDFIQEQPPNDAPVENFSASLVSEIDSNALWSCLQYLDDTPALKYQWLSSASNHKLLSALKIDSRNIFCGPWIRSSKCLRPEVNQPPKVIPFDDRSNSHHQVGDDASSEVSPNKSFTTEPQVKSSVPDPLFDWEGSGLVNPLFYSAKEDRSFDSEIRGSALENQISPEAQEVLLSLPDLSYMTKNYIAFKSISISK